MLNYLTAFCKVKLNKILLSTRKWTKWTSFWLMIPKLTLHSATLKEITLTISICKTTDYNQPPIFHLRQTVVVRSTRNVNTIHKKKNEKKLFMKMILASKSLFLARSGPIVNKMISITARHSTRSHKLLASWQLRNKLLKTACNKAN